MAVARRPAPAALNAGASDSEDDLATTSTHPIRALDGAAENKRSKVAAPKSGKPKTKAPGATAGKTGTKRKVPTTQSRQILKDRTNVQPESNGDAAEDFEDEDVDMGEDIPQAKRTKTGRKHVASRQADDPMDNPSQKVGGVPKRGRPAKRAPSPAALSTIQSSGHDLARPESVERSVEIDQVDAELARAPSPKHIPRYPERPRSESVQPLPPRSSARGGSSQPGYPPVRERSGSVSGTERRGGDPELRRKLNDLTKKCENLQLKYETLQDLSKRDAETNFEKLKRASDQKAQDAEDLIASLRTELAQLRQSSATTISETVDLQTQVDALTTSNEKVVAERDELRTKLQVAENEAKALEAKLVTARQQLSNSTQELRSHETAAPKGSMRHTGASATDAQRDKEQHMKENLYADLTGLIIRSVKRKEGEDEYDCIQTGRNGTLHFHLSVANNSSTPHPRTPSGLSYEEAEFAYEPLLDEGRDRALLDLLPDYLTEDICFPRAHAQKFYTKVVDCITKNIVMENGEED